MVILLLTNKNYDLQLLSQLCQHRLSYRGSESSDGILCCGYTAVDVIMAVVATSSRAENDLFQPRCILSGAPWVWARVFTTMRHMKIVAQNLIACILLASSADSELRQFKCDQRWTFWSQSSWCHWLTGRRCVLHVFVSNSSILLRKFLISDFAFGWDAKWTACTSLWKFVWVKLRNANCRKARTDCKW
jgi:hypothetical protein